MHCIHIETTIFFSFVDYLSFPFEFRSTINQLQFILFVWTVVFHFSIFVASSRAHSRCQTIYCIFSIKNSFDFFSLCHITSLATPTTIAAAASKIGTLDECLHCGHIFFCTLLFCIQIEFIEWNRTSITANSNRLKWMKKDETRLVSHDCRHVSLKDPASVTEQKVENEKKTTFKISIRLIRISNFHSIRLFAGHFCRQIHAQHSSMGKALVSPVAAVVCVVRGRSVHTSAYMFRSKLKLLRMAVECGPNRVSAN